MSARILWARSRKFTPNLNWWRRILSHRTLVPPVLEVALPLDLQEAENAVRIAKWAGAEDAARDVMVRAEDLLGQAEAYYVHKAGDKPISTVAREAVQTAEDARLIAMRFAAARSPKRR